MPACIDNCPLVVQQLHLPPGAAVVVIAVCETVMLLHLPTFRKCFNRDEERASAECQSRQWLGCGRGYGRQNIRHGLGTGCCCRAGTSSGGCSHYTPFLGLPPLPFLNVLHCLFFPPLPILFLTHRLSSSYTTGFPCSSTTCPQAVGATAYRHPPAHSPQTCVTIFDRRQLIAVAKIIRLVTHPHYSCEIVGWLGFNLITVRPSFVLTPLPFLVLSPLSFLVFAPLSFLVLSPLPFLATSPLPPLHFLVLLPLYFLVLHCLSLFSHCHSCFFCSRSSNFCISRRASHSQQARSSCWSAVGAATADTLTLPTVALRLFLGR